jgi:spore coat protein U-like protein
MRERFPFSVLALAALAASLALPSQLGADCTVDTAGGVAFGSYNPFDTAPLDSTGTITVDCTTPFSSPIRVEISKGRSSSYATRILALETGSHELGFNLFLDAAHTEIWGDGTENTWYSSQTPMSGVPLHLTVFGRIPARQNAWVGSYSDTLVVTVEF